MFTHTSGNKPEWIAIAHSDPRNTKGYTFPCIRINDAAKHVVFTAADSKCFIPPKAEKTRRCFASCPYGNFLVIKEGEERKMKSARTKAGQPVAIIRTGEIRFVRSGYTSEVQTPEPGDVVQLKSGEEAILLAKLNLKKNVQWNDDVVVTPAPDNTNENAIPGHLGTLVKSRITKEWD